MRHAAHPLVGRYPGWQTSHENLPSAERRQWCMHMSESCESARLLTVAGAAQVGFQPCGLIDLCFPFNCAGVKTGTGTNTQDCKQVAGTTLQ